MRDAQRGADPRDKFRLGRSLGPKAMIDGCCLDPARQNRLSEQQQRKAVRTSGYRQAQRRIFTAKRREIGREACGQFGNRLEPGG